jgi:hypothetical protein
MAKRDRRGGSGRARSAAIAAGLLALTSAGAAQAEPNEGEPIRVFFNGVDYASPGDLTSVGAFYHAHHGSFGGGYGELGLQPFRLGWSGPHLGLGTQDRNVNFRLGWLPVVVSRFAFGIGGTWEVTTVGVPATWMRPDDRDYFNAVGVEATAVMDLVFDGPHDEYRQVQAIAHAGYQIGIDHLRRPVYELGLIVSPFSRLPGIMFNATAIYSQFDYGSGTAPERVRMDGATVLFGIGYLPPAPRHSE